MKLIDLQRHQLAGTLLMYSFGYSFKLGTHVRDLKSRLCQPVALRLTSWGSWWSV
ncbi:hypothetical protein LOC67_17190 [Stieleria sp. JC731]|uniref:hypothetical protein n=1 Tax=Stieleria sp. JC731 TaxID=2894195 RepID=UPI001E4FDDB5|nr:hypothetical protein [Stieleria sp. JC731]MCC9602292.1 hypothetical protein [Stieleria sp. JC731]